MTKVENTQHVEIMVDGGYHPSTVTLKQGVPATLTFNRISDVGCLDQVQIPDFKVFTNLPLGDPQAVAIDTTNAGEHTFSCGMNMAHGKIVVAP